MSKEDSIFLKHILESIDLLETVMGYSHKKYSGI